MSHVNDLPIENSRSKIAVADSFELDGIALGWDNLDWETTGQRYPLFYLGFS